jgi:hypothetical protein
MTLAAGHLWCWQRGECWIAVFKGAKRRSRLVIVLY